MQAWANTPRAISRRSKFGRITIRKKLLLIAYHFPPFQGSTGIHRTLAFSRYLADYGWDVTVLTAHPRAYPNVSEQDASAVPSHVRVVRAFALDTQRHLSIFGRYPSALAVPDRWQSWIAGGVMSGSRIIRDWAPDAMMSTYPIASAHVIGARLQRRFGLPWIADLRDPMLQEAYPADPRLRSAYAEVEDSIRRQASCVTVTTEGTADLYRERFRDRSEGFVQLIPNGFDEESFRHLTVQGPRAQSDEHRKVRFLHSGLLYPKERNPNDFFAALAELKAEGALNPTDVEFAFRGSGNEDAYNRRIEELRLGDLVKLLPSIPYADALREMNDADACMLLQASNCNQQIPAKVYEYLYCRKPIFALTDPVGDTGRLLRSLGICPVTPLDDKAQIKIALPRFIQQLREASTPTPDLSAVLRYSRRNLTAELARVLEAAVTGPDKADHESAATN